MDRTEIAARQEMALRERRRRRGIVEPSVERKGVTFTQENWPDGLTVYPIAHGRGVPADAYRSTTPQGLAANSAIYACINTVATYFMEPPIDVFRESKEEGGEGQFVKARRHTIRRLLRSPNRVGPDDTFPVAFSMRVMAWVNQWNKHIDGNSYWLKVRSGDDLYGNVIAVWPIPPYMMTPVGPQSRVAGAEVIDPFGSSALIDHYLYDPLPGVIKARKIDPRNVVHFRLGIDPADYRRGLGPVKMLAREVASDELAANFTNALLRNSAIPGLIVIPEDGWVDEEVAAQIKGRMRAEFGGGNQGGVAVLSSGATVQQFGFDPKSMSLLTIHKHCEERIAAVMNVPAMVAQLGAGLEQASQFSNFHEAREMMSENTLLPLWQSDGEAMTGQLLGDFTDRDDEYLRYDVDQVRALQTDVTARFGRLQVAVKGGWLTANEARAQVGMKPIDEKKQQIPLTQGEDNRFNTMVEMGMVTLNEVRVSIGLPPVPEGDELLRDLVPGQFRGEAAKAGAPGENVDEVDAAQEASTLGSTTTSASGDDAPPDNAGLPAAENHRGANIQAPEPKSLDALIAEVGFDEVFRLWKAARESGTSLTRSLAG